MTFSRAYCGAPLQLQNIGLEQEDISTGATAPAIRGAKKPTYLHSIGGAPAAVEGDMLIAWGAAHDGRAGAVILIPEGHSETASRLRPAIQCLLAAFSGHVMPCFLYSLSSDGPVWGQDTSCGSRQALQIIAEKFSIS